MESRKSARASPRLTRPLMSNIVASAVSRILIFRLIESIPFSRTLSLKFLDGCHDAQRRPSRSGQGPPLRWYMRSRAKWASRLGLWGFTAVHFYVAHPRGERAGGLVRRPGVYSRRSETLKLEFAGANMRFTWLQIVVLATSAFGQ